jgi:hypothetical protein
MKNESIYQHEWNEINKDTCVTVDADGDAKLHVRNGMTEAFRLSDANWAKQQHAAKCLCAFLCS